MSDIDENGEQITVDVIAQLEAIKKGFHSLPYGYDSYVELLTAEYSDEYIVLANSLYQIAIDESLDDEFTSIIRVGDGEFEFTTRFHNGGTNLGEELASEVNLMDYLC